MTAATSVSVHRDKPKPQLQDQASAHKTISLSTEKSHTVALPQLCFPLLVLSKASPEFPPNLVLFPRLDSSGISSVPCSSRMYHHTAFPLHGKPSCQQQQRAETWHHIHWDSNVIFTSPFQLLNGCQRECSFWQFKSPR